MKTCVACDIEKPESEFYHNGKRLRPNCKGCSRVSRNEYNKGRPKQLKYGSLLRAAKRANISVDQVLQAIEDQHHQCKICNRHESEFKKGLCVDHCHLTGRFRGMLCHRCNTSIGQMDDNFDRLKAAIDYLLSSDSK
jgi:hypothetical protein